MARSVRLMLADSHVGAICVAVLLLWSIEYLFRAMWIPGSQIVEFLVTAIAILDVPYFSARLDWVLMISMGTYVYVAVVSFIGAQLVARWVYGMTPTRVLAQAAERLRRNA